MTTPPETPRPDPSRPESAGEADQAPAGGVAGVAAAVGPVVEASRGVGTEAVDEFGTGFNGTGFAGPRGDGDGGSARRREGDAVLDERTYDRILESRSERRLPLGDGTWHQLARAYVRVQLITQGAVILLVAAVAVAAQVITGVWWQWIPATVILLVTSIGLLITPRQARSFGYQLRHDDLVFRRGILWQRVVAVPYGRMQLVDITHGPLDRGFGIAQLKLVTAAASTGVTIPGLTQEAAEHLRDTLVAVAETRRTGL
ncbi:membrane protein YdbS with pleckstrin-like domain [Microbacterium proteolyticum]|nr:membrane protein YdbS with pleckstrin-like domain [Microbacterium sp. SORGH_AS_0344]MDQ1168423.1 membrane protein YdbS with pleckstrin-like domain [Microbacterium proteolyticum]